MAGQAGFLVRMDHQTRFPGFFGINHNAVVGIVFPRTMAGFTLNAILHPECRNRFRQGSVWRRNMAGQTSLAGFRI